MFIELIATFFAGAAVAGLFMALNFSLGGRLPRWMTPLAAGLGMIAVTVWSEYTWYERTSASLPEGLVVTETHEAQQLYRPWTFAAPVTDRFMALDVATMRSSQALPEQHLADLYTLGRWRPVRKLPVLIDCAGSRRALLPADVVFAEDGSVQGAFWADVNGQDPLLAAACQA